MQENFHNMQNAWKAEGLSGAGAAGRAWCSGNPASVMAEKSGAARAGEKKAAVHTDGGDLTAGAYSLRCFSVSQ